MKMRRRLQLVYDNTEEQWMNTAVKVAFATNDREKVNQHFGASESFAIYSVDPEHFAFIEAMEFDQLAMDGNEDKLMPKIQALEGCVAVYAQAVGGSAVKQLKAKGVQAMKVPPNSDIKGLLQGLQRELQIGPSAWLARAIQDTMPADLQRFDAMEAEGWEE